MNLIKNNLLKIILILVVIVSGVFCAYSISNNKAVVSSNISSSSQRDFFQGEKNQWNGAGIQGNPNRGMRGDMAGTSSNSNVSTALFSYSVLFLGALAAALYFYKKTKLKIESKNIKLILTCLLAAGLFLRISIGLLTEGFSTDLSLFRNWALSAANNFTGFYSGTKTSDYPPLYIYVLFLVGKAMSFPTLSSYSVLLLKLPSILADIASAYLVYRIGKKYISQELSMMISVFYAFNPAVLVNSVFWGQVDSFFTMIVLTAVFLMTEGKIALSSIVFTIGVLMKPQGIIYLPVLFFELVRQRSIKNFIKAAVSAAITGLFVILPFSFNQGITWIFNLFSKTLGEYPYASVNGFNFFSLIGKNYTNDSETFFIFSYHVWGTMFIVLVTLFTWFIYIKGNLREIIPLAALIQIAGVFTFSTRMHERYLFPAAALAILAFIYLRDKRILILSIIYSITIFMNTYYILYNTSGGMNNSSSGFTMFITSLTNVAAFIYLAKAAIDIAVKKKTCLLKE
ncbi:MAG: hypothetical protein ABRQ27_08715 [Clostridiaceae bacterium]